MSWNTIIGQIRVKGIIQRALKEHSIAHAYCFYGNEGIGAQYQRIVSLIYITRRHNYKNGIICLILRN